MWEGGSLRPPRTAGKLETLYAKGPVCEGNPLKASIEHVTITHTVNAIVSPYSIHGNIIDKPFTFLVDTGSAISLLDNAVWNRVSYPCFWIRFHIFFTYITIYINT